MRQRRGSSILVLVGAVVVACSSATPGPTPSPTPIVAIELTPAPSASAPPASGGNCLERAGQVVLVGQPCLKGTFELVNDVTTVGATTTKHYDSPVRAELSLWAVAPGTLKGAAHLSYSVMFTGIDTSGKGCHKQIWNLAPVTWDVQLVGQYSTSSDGSIQVTTQATPDRGPGFTEHATGCPVPDTQYEGIAWQLRSLSLTGGVYDYRHDYPLPAQTTGTNSITIHVEEMP